jgi:hypothetical protein
MITYNLGTLHSKHFKTRYIKEPYKSSLGTNSINNFTFETSKNND